MATPTVDAASEFTSHPSLPEKENDPRKIQEKKTKRTNDQ